MRQDCPDLWKLQINLVSRFDTSASMFKTIFMANDVSMFQDKSIYPVGAVSWGRQTVKTFSLGGNIGCKDKRKLFIVGVNRVPR